MYSSYTQTRFCVSEPFLQQHAIHADLANWLNVDATSPPNGVMNEPEGGAPSCKLGTSGRAEIRVVQSLDRTQDAVSSNLNDETAGGYDC